MGNSVFWRKIRHLVLKGVVTIEKLIAEGDEVAALATYSGTLTGPMGEYPATGRSVEITFLSIFRIDTGRVAELWVEWDNVAMLTQLGLLPPPPGG
jgi:predicted ester cyclase